MSKIDKHPISDNALTLCQYLIDSDLIKNIASVTCYKCIKKIESTYNKTFTIEKYDEISKIISLDVTETLKDRYITEFYHRVLGKFNTVAVDGMLENYLTKGEIQNPSLDIVSNAAKGGIEKLLWDMAKSMEANLSECIFTIIQI